MFDENGEPMSNQWDMVDVAIFSEENSSPDIRRPVRLGGPWVRHRLYTATVPDGTDRLWIGTNRTSWKYLANPRIGSSGMLWRTPGLRSRISRTSSPEREEPRCNILG